MASCIECNNPLPPNKKSICLSCERKAKKKASVAGEPSPSHATAPLLTNSPVATPPQSVSTTETKNPPVTSLAKASGGQSKIKVFHCPDCNMPLAPGDTSCLKCGRQFSQPIPRIVVSAHPEKPAQPAQTQQAQPHLIYQDPVLEGTDYHCPKCREYLGTGTRQCANCGTQFMHPVPAYKMPYREAQRHRQADEVVRREMELQRQVSKQNQIEEGIIESVREAGRRLSAAKEALQGNSAGAEQETVEEAQPCPQCHAMMTPGNYVCTSCGAVVSKQPQETVPTFNTSRQPSLLAKVIIALAVACVIGIINSAVNSSHLPTSLPPGTLPVVTPSAPSVADLTQSGEIYYTQGRYADAITAYQSALQTNPPPDVQADLTRRITINQQLLAQVQQRSTSASFSIPGRWLFVGEMYCLNSDGTGYEDTMNDQGAPDGGNISLKRTTFPLRWSTQGRTLRLLMYTQAQGTDHYAIDTNYMPLVVDYNYRFSKNGNLEISNPDESNRYMSDGYVECQPAGSADR